MKLTWSQTKGIAVFAPESERPVGFLKNIYFNPETGKILALQTGGFSVCTPIDIESWNEVEIRLNSVEALSSPLEILRLKEFGLKRCFLPGKLVRSVSGRFLGEVLDFTVDTGSGTLTQISVGFKFLFWEWNATLYSWADIKEITERELRLNVEPEKTIKIRTAQKNPVKVMTGLSSV